jgi:hypothetical protein
MIVVVIFMSTGLVVASMSNERAEGSYTDGQGRWTRSGKG